MELLFVWLFFAIIVGLLANSTTLGFWGGLLLSILLSPIIGFIIYLFYPSKASQERQEQLLHHAINNNRNPVSTADELEKLAALRDKGIITPADFEKQKAKLLN